MGLEDRARMDPWDKGEVGRITGGGVILMDAEVAIIYIHK